MKKPKEFVSSNREKIKAELLRLMRDPKCYAISTIQLEVVMNDVFRDRIIKRVGQNKWVSYITGCDIRRMKRSYATKLYPRSSRHVAEASALASVCEPTLIVGWFA